MLDEIVSITGVSARHWQPFAESSPGGISFGGFLCRHESDMLGALAITSVNGAERLDLVRGMPKIHYPYLRDKEGRPRLAIPLAVNVQEARFTRKLDGNAIIWWGLKDDAGEVAEVIPRTRLQPVLTASRWGDWPALLDEALPDRTGVERAVTDQEVVLAFELWGHHNTHLVSYDVPLRLTLHTAIRHKRIVSHRLLLDFASRYGFDLVESIEVARPDEESLAEAYRRWQAVIEERNRAAGEGVFLDEGAVLVLSTRETATYWKCKPASIEEIHWAEGRHLSRELIIQALHKMAENAYDFGSGTSLDVATALEEDFAPEEVAAEQDLIDRVWLEFKIELERRAWLRGLLDASGLDPRDLPSMMRHLSQHYPKKEMGWVYATVRSLYG